MESKIRLLLVSYTLEELLEENDIEESFVVKWLIEEGLIDLGDYFD